MDVGASLIGYASTLSDEVRELRPARQRIAHPSEPYVRYPYLELVETERRTLEGFWRLCTFGYTRRHQEVLVVTLCRLRRHELQLPDNFLLVKDWRCASTHIHSCTHTHTHKHTHIHKRARARVASIGFTVTCRCAVDRSFSGREPGLQQAP